MFSSTFDNLRVNMFNMEITYRQTRRYIVDEMINSMIGVVLVVAQTAFDFEGRVVSMMLLLTQSTLSTHLTSKHATSPIEE